MSIIYRWKDHLHQQRSRWYSVFLLLLHFSKRTVDRCSFPSRQNFQRPDSCRFINLQQIRQSPMATAAITLKAFLMVSLRIRIVLITLLFFLWMQNGYSQPYELTAGTYYVREAEAKPDQAIRQTVLLYNRGNSRNYSNSSGNV